MRTALILFVSLLLAPASIFALARAPFPNSKTLQPIPTNVRPNISGNVSATPSPIPASTYYEGGSSDTSNQTETINNVSAPTAQVPQPQSHTPLSSIILYTSLGLLAAVMLYKIFQSTSET